MPASDTRKTLPVLYVFFGLIATGKSTLAQAWARHTQGHYLNSDRVRKELAGISPTEDRRVTVDSGIYSGEFTRKTYKALLEKTEALLRRGDSVILDASYQYARDRQNVRELAANVNSQVYFILCQCSEVEMKRRMEARMKDPAAVSDGRWEIYLQQKKRFEPPLELPAAELITINTQLPLAALVQELDKKIT